MYSIVSSSRWMNFSRRAGKCAVNLADVTHAVIEMIPAAAIQAAETERMADGASVSKKKEAASAASFLVQIIICDEEITVTHLTLAIQFGKCTNCAAHRFIFFLCTGILLSGICAADQQIFRGIERRDIFYN